MRGGVCVVLLFLLGHQALAWTTFDPVQECPFKIQEACSSKGGFCVHEPFQENCGNGTLKERACKSKYCQCCIPAREPSCDGKITNKCKQKGGSCVTAPFKSNCDGKLSKKLCKGKDCQCCMPIKAPSCEGKILNSCTKKGGSCVLAPFEDNCKAGKLSSKACKGKKCQCCIPEKAPSCEGKLLNSCVKKGGHCVLAPFQDNCRGTLKEKACSGSKCQCCIPDPTPAPTAAPTQPPTPAPTKVQTNAATKPPPTQAPTQPPTPPPTQPPTPLPTQPPSTPAPPKPSTLGGPITPAPTPAPTQPPTPAPTQPPTPLPTQPPSTPAPPKPSTLGGPITQAQTTAPPKPTTPVPPKPTTPAPTPAPTQPPKQPPTPPPTQPPTILPTQPPSTPAPPKPTTLGGPITPAPTTLAPQKPTTLVPTTIAPPKPTTQAPTTPAPPKLKTAAPPKPMTPVPTTPAPPKPTTPAPPKPTTPAPTTPAPAKPTTPAPTTPVPQPPTTVAPKPAAPCPQDFSLAGSQCLNVNIEETLSWEEARDTCAAKGARLHVPADINEFTQFVEDNYNGKQFWIGASDLEDEGNWVWLNGEPLQSGFPWAFWQPDNWFNEDCMEYTGGRYNDRECNDKVNYICEACPTGYVRVGPQCLSINTEVKLNWQEASDKCQANGDSLAVVRDMVALQEYLGNQYGGADKTFFWLGSRKSQPQVTWRDDYHCGSAFPLANGAPSTCNPNGHTPCCSPHNWCGVSDDHCKCSNCKDFAGAPITKYYGPQAKIWGDDECANIGNHVSKTLAECKDLCDSTSGCTAMNYKENEDCVLRNCGSTVPEPNWEYSPYVGYSKVSSDWVWVNGGDVTDIPWGPNEPNNSGGEEDCFDFITDHGYNDNVCSMKSFFVCSKGM